MTGEQQERPRDFGSLMTGLARVAARSADDALAKTDFGWLEYAILRALLEVPHATASQLSHLLPVELSSISRSVAVLADRRLLRRRRDTSDRRVVRLSLTADGRELAEELQQTMEGRFGALVEGISDADLDTFTAVTHRIMANYRAVAAAR